MTEHRAITIKQPWAWAILNAGKNIENRSWSPNFRGRLWIHTSGHITRRHYNEACEFIYNITGMKPPDIEELTLGAIIGFVDFKTVHLPDARVNKWHIEGYHGWSFENPKELEIPIPCKGRLLLWDCSEHLDLCRGCGVPFETIPEQGCSDDLPDLCDDCWDKSVSYWKAIHDGDD